MWVCLKFDWFSTSLVIFLGFSSCNSKTLLSNSCEKILLDSIPTQDWLWKYYRF